MSRVHAMTLSISVKPGMEGLFDEKEIEAELLEWVERADDVMDRFIIRKIEELQGSYRYVDWQVHDVVEVGKTWESWDD